MSDQPFVPLVYLRGVEGVVQGSLVRGSKQYEFSRYEYTEIVRSVGFFEPKMAAWYPTDRVAQIDFEDISPKVHEEDLEAALKEMFGEAS